MEQENPVKEPEVDRELARRMKQACDRNPKIPGEKEGRLVWIMNELKTRYSMDVVLQSVHRWYHGRARPRNQKMIALAEVLGVDVGWLGNGLGDVYGEAVPAQKAKPPIRHGAINIAAGLLEMAGISCAWPEEDDATGDYAHFYAIIRGKQRRFHVVVASSDKEGQQTLRLPVEFAKCAILVLRRVSFSAFDLWSVPSEKIEGRASPRGGYAEFPVTIKGSLLSFKGAKLSAMASLEGAFS